MLMRTDRLRGMTLARSLLVALLVVLVGSATPAFAAQLQLARTIRTSPFAGSTLSMKDSEGSAYVPRDNSLWLADDNGRAVFEIDPSTRHVEAQDRARRVRGRAEAGRWTAGGDLPNQGLRVHGV